MNKKILISLSTIIAVAVIAVGGTIAYFFDSETSTGNSFAAGTLNLNLDGKDDDVVKFTESNLKPSDSGFKYWTVKNAGTINGTLSLISVAVANDDNGCADPESPSDTTCGDTGGKGGGELGANMNVAVFIDKDMDGTLDSEDTSLYSGTLDGLVAGPISTLALNAGLSEYITLKWEVPSATGNIIQSDSVNLDMTFQLNQI